MFIIYLIGLQGDNGGIFDFNHQKWKKKKSFISALRVTESAVKHLKGTIEFAGTECLEKNYLFLTFVEHF